MTIKHGICMFVFSCWLGQFHHKFSSTSDQYEALPSSGFNQGMKMKTTRVTLMSLYVQEEDTLIEITLRSLRSLREKTHF